MGRAQVLQQLLVVVLVGTLLSFPAFGQEEPPLPAGLEPEKTPDTEEPALQPGLEPSDPGLTREPALPPGLPRRETQPPTEPALPEGLGKQPTEPQVREKRPVRARVPFQLSGFWEARLGFRTQDDPDEKDASIGETRLQLEAERSWRSVIAKVTTDFLYDPVLDRYAVDLEEGDGFFDLREANLAFTPAAFMDVKAGRQILTWGTGDLLFINDLFPKDWNSFFIGRDEEYLKAPSDSVKVSLFSRAVNLNVVYTPRFDADRYIDGQRISYYKRRLGRIAGRDDVIEVEKPDEWFDDNELAVRLYRTVSGYELSAYGYYGFWKSPAGINALTGRATFPPLSVYGASVRGNVLRGIGYTEFGYYDSRDDRSGNDPFIRNSEFRFLLGYEQEVATDFTLALQYYLEHMMDHNDYRRSLPAGTPRTDENRHVITVRLTKLLMNQNLKLSLFTYYSPSDQDAYFRFNINYKIDDHWSANIGGNVFVGADDHTFFGQFRQNTNVYGGIRYGF